MVQNLAKGHSWWVETHLLIDLSIRLPNFWPVFLSTFYSPVMECILQDGGDSLDHCIPIP